MPASNAASTTAAVPAASVRQPKLLHPMPTSDTLMDPILRYSMTQNSSEKGKEHKRLTKHKMSLCHNKGRESEKAPDRRLSSAQNLGDADARVFLRPSLFPCRQHLRLLVAR